MFLKSSKGNINSSLLIITFLICIAIALGVAFFHHYNSPSKYLEYKASDLTEKLAGVSNFPVTAKNLLNSDKDISYIKLLDRNGVLEESFGNDNLGNTERFTINGKNNTTIVLGLKKPTDLKLDTYLLIWSLLIGSVLSLFLIIILSMRAVKSQFSFKELEGSMNRIAEGDYSARVDMNADVIKDNSVASVYQNFNRMAESLDNGSGQEAVDEDTLEDHFNLEEESLSETDKANGEDLLEHTDLDNDDVEEVVFNEGIDEEVADEPELELDQEEFDFREEADEEPIIADPVSEEAIQEMVNNDQFAENNSSSDISTESIVEDDSKSFRPKIVLPQSGEYPKNRNVTVIVAKINDFEDLTQRLDSVDLGSFLTEYRKSASQIISAYGGVIEALLQDEIVALFNAPDQQNDPELRAVCAAVEVLHELATMAKKRRTEGKEMITGKIGIGMQSLSYYTETGVPDSVKKVIKEARYVCDNASLWKVYVTNDLYELVNEHVDVKEFLIEGDVLYSITGVEQGVVERENFS